MAFVQPLDLRNLLINTLAGNIEIFSFLSFIAISILAATFKMPNTVFLIMIILFSVLMAQYVGVIYVIVLLIISIVIFKGIAKAFT